MARKSRKKGDYPSEAKILIALFDCLCRNRGEATPLDEIKNSLPFDRDNSHFESNFDNAIEAIKENAHFIKSVDSDTSLIFNDSDDAKPAVKPLFTPCWSMTDDVLKGTILDVSKRKNLKKALVEHFSGSKIASLACCKGGTCYVMAKEIFDQVNLPTKLITANLLIICEAMKHGVELLIPFGITNLKTAYISPIDDIFHGCNVISEENMLSDIYAEVRLISFRSVYLNGKGNLCFAGSAGKKDASMVKACFRPKAEKGKNVIIVVGSEKIAVTGEIVASAESDELFDDSITYTLITDIGNPNKENTDKWKVLNKFLEVGDNTSVRTHFNTFKNPESLKFSN